MQVDFADLLAIIMAADLTDFTDMLREICEIGGWLISVGREIGRQYRARQSTGLTAQAQALKPEG